MEATAVRRTVSDQHLMTRKGEASLLENFINNEGPGIRNKRSGNNFCNRAAFKLPVHKHNKRVRRS